MDLEEQVLHEVVHSATIAMDACEVPPGFLGQDGVQLLERAEIAALIRDHQLRQPAFVRASRRRVHARASVAPAPGRQYFFATTTPSGSGPRSRGKGRIPRAGEALDETPWKTRLADRRLSMDRGLRTRGDPRGLSRLSAHDRDRRWHIHDGVPGRRVRAQEVRGAAQLCRSGELRPGRNRSDARRIRGLRQETHRPDPPQGCFNFGFNEVFDSSDVSQEVMDPRIRGMRIRSPQTDQHPVTCVSWRDARDLRGVLAST